MRKIVVGDYVLIKESSNPYNIGQVLATPVEGRYLVSQQVEGHGEVSYYQYEECVELVIKEDNPELFI